MPDPIDEATFRSAVRDWDEVYATPHAGLLAWYRSLLQLRAPQAALAAGATRGLADGFRAVGGARGEVLVDANHHQRPRSWRASA